MKLQLVFQRIKGMSCIRHPHYDLCTVEKAPKNTACILTGGTHCNKIIKQMVKLWNEKCGGEKMMKKITTADACAAAILSQEWPEKRPHHNLCNISLRTSNTCNCGAIDANAMRERFLAKIEGMVGK